MSAKPDASSDEINALSDLLPPLWHEYHSDNRLQPEDEEFKKNVTKTGNRAWVAGCCVSALLSHLAIKRLKVKSQQINMMVPILSGMMVGDLSKWYSARPLIPRALYLDTAFGAEVRERFRSEHPRSALLRGTGHMRTLDQMARNRADENTRERGRLGSRQPQVEPDNYPPPKLDDSYFFSATDFEGYNAHGDHHEADAAPDSFDSDSRHSAHAYDHRDDDDEQQYADAWVVEDGVNDDVPVVNATPHPGYESSAYERDRYEDERDQRRRTPKQSYESSAYGGNRYEDERDQRRRTSYESSAYGRDRYEDERDQRRRTPKQRTRTWDEVRREAAMNGK